MPTLPNTTPPLTPQDLLAKWRAEADYLAPINAGAAHVAREHAAQLDEALRADDDAALTLVEAADQTGLSADHLGRLVRQGRIPNAGRPHAPKIRRRDLPAPRATHARARLREAAPEATVSPARAQIAEAVVTLHKRAG